jgi:hypothetical protein
MTERDRDDLFLDALEHDEDVAWKLAAAAARPTPPALRATIVGAHRSRPRRGLVPRLAFAAAAAVVLVLALGVASGTRVVALDPVTGSGGRAALVATPVGDPFLILALPTPPSGKAYEAWVIREGAPAPAGLSAGSGILALRSGIGLRAGDVIAITVEVAAGATRPTSDPILMGRL